MQSNPKKEETKLKILIYGDNINALLIKQLYDNEKCKGKKEKYKELNYEHIKHNILDWHFLCFENINNLEMIDLIKEDCSNHFFHHVLLLFIEDLQKQIDIISQIYDNGSRIFFPFIIFCCSEKKEKDDVINLLEKAEKKDEIDHRYISFIYRDCQSLDILKILWDKCCYYNQLGNSITLPSFDKLKTKETKYIHSFNFFVVGKTGVGKSTFVNILSRGLVALERGGKNVTVGIKKYRCLNAPIYIYDTEGFSTGNELEKTKNNIFEILSELNKTKQAIHGIFYLFNGKSKRTFDDNEEKLITELFSKGIDIYFLINFMSKKKNNKRTKEVFIEENKLRFNNPKFNKLFEENLFIVNIKNEDFDCYGLDIVFDMIYEKFKNSKIDLDAVKNLKDDNAKIFPLLKNSLFFKNINSSNDVLEYIKSVCMYEVLTAATLSGIAGALDIFPFTDIPVIYGIEILMIISIATSFGVKMDEKKGKELLKTLGASLGTTGALGVTCYFIATALKLIPGVGTIIGGIINSSVASSGAFSIGKLCIEYFSKIFGKNHVTVFLNERAEACNKGIEFFNEFKINLKESNDYSKI